MFSLAKLIVFYKFKHILILMAATHSKKTAWVTCISEGINDMEVYIGVVYRYIYVTLDHKSWTSHKCTFF